MQKFVILLAFSVILLSPSCSKDRHPYVKIKTPKNGDVYNAGDVIIISADMSDSDALQGESLEVIKVPSYDIIKSFYHQGFWGNRIHNLIDSFTCEPASQYKIIVGGAGHGTWQYDTIVISTN